MDMKSGGEWSRSTIPSVQGADLQKVIDSSEELEDTALERNGQLEGYRYQEVFKAIVEHANNGKENHEDGIRIAVVIDGGAVRGAEPAGALLALASNSMLKDGILCGTSVGAMLALTAASADETGEHRPKLYASRNMFATLAKDPSFVNQAGAPALIWNAIKSKVGAGAASFLDPSRAIDLALGKGISKKISENFTVMIQAALANPKDGEETIVHLAPSTRSVYMAEAALASASIPFPVAKTHAMNGEMYVEGGGTQPIDAEFADGGVRFSISKMLKNLPVDKRPTHVLIFSSNPNAESSRIRNQVGERVRNFITSDFNPALQDLYSDETRKRTESADADMLRSFDIPFAVICNATEIRHVEGGKVKVEKAVGGFDTDANKIKHAGMQMYARMIDALEKFSGTELRRKMAVSDASSNLH